MKKMGRHKRVMIFGVFDGLHPGHLSFLRQARRYGGELIVVVARNSASRKLKSKFPIESERKRLAAVREIRGVTDTLLGDRRQSSYNVIKKYKPDIICLGYDQDELKYDLEQKIRNGILPKMELVTASSYRPEEFRSSLLNHDKI